ncbi:MAG: DUF4397 domain-containing protein, partial [Armatimonadetes bacterium]|nr:DUF4397 domain-containing protein [Armatimonadota bacterium]
MLRLLALAALLCSQAAMAAEAPALARYRLLHAVPGGPEVDVYLDGEQATARLGYGSLLPYRSLRAGLHNFKALPSGGSTFLDDRDAIFEAGRDYTIALVQSGGAPIWLRILDRRPEQPGGHVRAVHLAAGAPNLDFLAAGQKLATLAYGQVSRPTPVTAS